MLGVCILAAVVYYNTLSAGFVYDDNRVILTNPDVTSSTNLRHLLHNDFWGTPLSSSNSHGSYRPLTVATYRFNYFLFGLHPAGYHLTNVILHSIATGLVLHTGRVVMKGRRQTVAALLFAVHPVHTEAVAGLVGRADLLACIFYLLSFNAYVSHVYVRRQRFKYSDITQHKFKEIKLRYTAKQCWCYGKVDDCICSNINIQKFTDNGESAHFIKQYLFLLLSVFWGFCATLCKETGITVFLLSAVYEVLVQIHQNHKNLNISSLLILTASFISLLYLRLNMMDTKLPTFSKADNPTAHNPSFITRTLTFLYLPVVDFQILLYPKWLSFDWSMDAVQRISTIWDHRNLFSLSFYTVLYYMVKSALKCFTGRKFSECSVCFDNRYCLCKRSINNNLPQCECSNGVRLSKQGRILLCLAFLVVPFIPATNLPFYVGFVVAERVLYMPSIGYCFIVGFGCNILLKKVDKRLSMAVFSGLLFVMVLRTLQRNADWRDEESLYRSGVEINPPKAYGNLGSILSTQGRLQEAEAAFKLALSQRPNMADVHYNLGNLQRGLKRFSESISSYEMAIKFRPSLAVAHLNLGVLLASLGQCERAEQVLRRCSQLDSTGLKDIREHQRAKVNALIRLGEIYYQSEKLEEAVSACTEGMTKEMGADLYQLQVLKHLLQKAESRLGISKKGNS